MISDADLALSFKNGNRDAFDELYIRHLKGIFAFVFYRVMDRMTAEDLTSQTFMKALEHMHSYNPNKGAFSTWVYRIARNTVHDHFRTTRPSENIDDVWDLASDDNPFLDASSSLDTKQVRDTLHALPKDKRDLIMMRLWDGLSYKEIADLTGKSEDSCKMAFSRTINDLRSSMTLPAFLLLILSRFTL
jgi:RNA polymerase sigma-70 factor (ECF subfamily)